MSATLTESIALLALCGTTFEPVVETEISAWTSTNAEEYSLSVQQEQQVAEAFAILLANTDDPHAVGAVCLEEQPNSASLLVRTAVNSGMQEERMENFRKIAYALRQCTAERDIDTFFGVIVTICSPRLLIRLRSSHAKTHRKAGRPAIIPKLVDGIKLLKDLPSVPRQVAFIDSQVTLLSAAFRSLEALPSTAVRSQPGTCLLKSILLTVEQMLASTDIAALLDMIPKDCSSWSGLASQSLAKSLKSLAQYCHVAQYLLRRARKSPVFRSLRVAEVSSGLSREGPDSAEPDYGTLSTIMRPATLEDKKKSTAMSIKLAIKLKKRKEEVERDIQKHAAQAKRVHAEIQLLLYYELNSPKGLLPRTICSNKHACLLCYLFIKAHGRFLVRSCHGRLYPRWRVPPLSELRLSGPAELRVQQAIDELANQLDLRIEHCLNRPRLRMSDPQESIVFVPDIYTPSMLSAVTNPESVVGTSTMPVANHSRSSSVTTTLKCARTARRVQLYMLEHTRTIQMRVYSGFPIRVHTRCIHLELTYEWALASASSASTTTNYSEESQTTRTGLLVQVEYIAEKCSILSSGRLNMYDLATPLEIEHIPPGILLSGSGLILKKRDETMTLRVLHSNLDSV